jgi:hypothetical protein
MAQRCRPRSATLGSSKDVPPAGDSDDVDLQARFTSFVARSAQTATVLPRPQVLKML